MRKYKIKDDKELQKIIFLTEKYLSKHGIKLFSYDFKLKKEIG